MDVNDFAEAIEVRAGLLLTLMAFVYPKRVKPM
jgi:hypothetical protein